MTAAEHEARARELLAEAQETSPAGGHLTVSHHLELAFVYALLGDLEQVDQMLAAADAELERYPNTLGHLQRDYSVLKARTYAVCRPRRRR